MKFLASFLVAAAAVLAVPLHAQTAYPNKPIRLVVPSRSPSFCETARAKMSVAPPAGNGTTSRIGLLG